MSLFCFHARAQPSNLGQSGLKPGLYPDLEQTQTETRSKPGLDLDVSERGGRGLRVTRGNRCSGARAGLTQRAVHRARDRGLLFPAEPRARAQAYCGRAPTADTSLGFP